MTGALKTLERVMARVETWALVAVLGTMASLAVVQVVLKLFGHGVQWLEMLVRYLVVWVGFLGGAVASQQARHITIDVVTRFVKGPAKNAVGVTVNLSAAVLTGLLLYVSWMFLREKLDSASTALTMPLGGHVIAVPEWVFAAMIPLGLCLMGWHFLVHAVLYLAGEDPADDQGGDADGGG